MRRRSLRARGPGCRSLAWCALLAGRVVFCAGTMQTTTGRAAGGDALKLACRRRTAEGDWAGGGSARWAGERARGSRATRAIPSAQLCNPSRGVAPRANGQSAHPAEEVVVDLVDERVGVCITPAAWGGGVREASNRARPCKAPRRMYVWPTSMGAGPPGARSPEPTQFEGSGPKERIPRMTYCPAPCSTQAGCPVGFERAPELNCAGLPRTLRS